VQGAIVVNGQDRFAQIEQTLKDLSGSTAPGLNERVDFSVSGASIQEFLRGLAESNNLNINVDPSLNFKIYNNFTNEKVMNILLFLVKEYDLDIRFVGSIMSFYKYNAPPPPITVKPVKEIEVKYNSFTNLITMDLSSDTLDKVARKITQVAKKNVILSNGIGNKLVSGYIQDMPFDNALQKMAYANNLKVIKTEDDFYILKSMEEGDDLVVSNPVNNNKNKPFSKKPNTKPNSPNATSGELYVEINKDSLGNKLVSMEAVNAPISDALKKVAEEADINYFLLSDIKGATTTRVLNVVFDEFLRRLFLGTDYTYKTEAGMYLIGDRKLEGLRAHRVFQFQYRSYDQVQDVIPGELKKGVEIKEFKNLNSIILTGSLPQILEIEALLKQLDRVVPMVLIEVIIVDIRKTRSVSTGISAGLSDTVKTGGTILPGVNFTFSSKSINNFLSYLGTNNMINLGRVTPNFYMKLSALESSNNVEVRSTPKLSTLNGHEATLAIGQKRYYANQTQNVLGSLNTQTVITQQFHEVQANLAINIKPVVSGDDQVTLNIDVSNSDFLDAPTNAPPSSTQSQFKSIIRVKNEEMIVLGGLERNEKDDKGSGVPILSRIPILKWIFSSKTRTKSKAVTIVFIKPTIIY
jgi:type IV pilus assembly protein PilQ